MIFKIKDKENIYNVDDLKSFGEQPSAFQKAFEEAIKENKFGDTIANFDNAQVSVFDSNRVIVTIKENDNENI